MCNWLNEKLEQSPDWLSHIWLSNEARFHLHGAVNNNNNVFWGEEKPKKSVRTSLEFRKNIVFVALNAKHGLMGNYWKITGLRKMGAPLPPTVSAVWPFLTLSW